MRNPIKRKEDEVQEGPEQQVNVMQTPQGVVVEREVNLSLINDKLNYAMGLLHKIAQACEVEIN